MSLTTQVSAMDFAVYPITTTSGLLTEAFIVETDSVSQATPFVNPAGKNDPASRISLHHSKRTTVSAPPSVGGLSGSCHSDWPEVPTCRSWQCRSSCNPNGSLLGFTLPLFENIGGSVYGELHR